MGKDFSRSVKGQGGYTILEVIVALAVVGLALPLVLGGLSMAIKTTDRIYDRSVLFELAQSQLESIEGQSYSVNASGYSLITPPSGYSIQVSTAPAVTYTYASPLSTTTEETVQLVTVDVTGVRGNMAVSRYKVRE
ncbi:MAG: type II secretion system protein [Chloroflexi bacterium]|nr:type II secretion system protein [Chloroflexota bacterium]